jgi:hypothetical protein
MNKIINNQDIVIEAEIIEEEGTMNNTQQQAAQEQKQEEIKVNQEMYREFKKGMNKHWVFREMLVRHLKSNKEDAVQLAIKEAMESKDKELIEGAKWFAEFSDQEGAADVFVVWAQKEFTARAKIERATATFIEKTGYGTGWSMIKVGEGLVWLGNKMITGGNKVQEKTAEWADKIRNK